MEFKPTLYQDLSGEKVLSGDLLAMVAYDLTHLIILEAKMSLVDGAKQYVIVTYTFRNRDPESDTRAANSATFYLMVDDVHQIATFSHKGRNNLQNWGVPYQEVKLLEDFFRFYIKELEIRKQFPDEEYQTIFDAAAVMNARLEPDHTMEFVSYDSRRDAGIRLVVDDMAALEIPFDGIERLKLDNDLGLLQKKAQIRVCQCMVRLAYTVLHLYGDGVLFQFNDELREIQIWSPDVDSDEKKLILSYKPEDEVFGIETSRGLQGVNVPKEIFREYFVDPVQQYRQHFATTLQAVSHWEEWLK